MIAIVDRCSLGMIRLFSRTPHAFSHAGHEQLGACAVTINLTWHESDRLLVRDSSCRVGITSPHCIDIKQILAPCLMPAAFRSSALRCLVSTATGRAIDLGSAPAGA